MQKQNTIFRLISLDVFRGLTIVLMILVNSPGTPLAYTWLEHSAWNGCTLADLVFPFFIVIVGISAVIALSNLKQKAVSLRQTVTMIIWRSVTLFFLGLLLNMLPNHFDLTHLRIPGVLQRIALCYFVSSLLFLTTRLCTQIILIILLLVGYLFIDQNWLGYIDQLIFRPQHLYTSEFDPEGLLSTLPAIASVLLGNCLGYCLISSHTRSQQLWLMSLAGLGLTLLGWFCSFICPFNKSTWSSAYVLWTSGLCYLSFALCFFLIEIKQWCHWSKPFSFFGKNALLVYFLHILLLKIQALIRVPSGRGDSVNLKMYITDFFFGHFTPENASLCYAITYTLFLLFVLKFRSMIFLKR